MRYIEDQTIALLSSLHSLRKLVLPRYTLTEKIIEALSLHSHLETIEFQYHDYQGCGVQEDLSVFDPTLPEGAFPALWDFSTTLTCDAAAPFFDLPHAPAHLTTIFLDSHLIEAPADVLHLFTVLADNCPLLHTFGLATHIDATGPLPLPHEVIDKDVCITIETMTPLFQCTKIVSFDIDHHRPLCLRQPDLETLASKWPSLEVLQLNCEPAYVDHPTLTLEALFPFARHCPRLRHLSLFVDASSGAVPGAPSLPEQYPVFGSLKKLFLGVSVIEEGGEGVVALFLSQVCPVGCALDSGVTWEEAGEVTGEKVRMRCKRWDKVAELLPLLTRLRVEERERARLLKEEVEDLRVRTGLLRDRTEMKRVEDSCIIS